jgi:hypothetical protein
MRAPAGRERGEIVNVRRILGEQTMKLPMDERDWYASHDTVEDRLPSFRQILLGLAVLALVGIHWVPVVAYLDGADARTVGEAVLEMWGLAAVVLAGAGLLIAVIMVTGLMIGRVLAGITDCAGWPGEEDANDGGKRNRERLRGPEGEQT